MTRHLHGLSYSSANDQGYPFMPAPALPIDEMERLQLVEHYRLEEAGSELTFDHLTRTASLAFDVPIALVSIITADEQVFKGNCGLDVGSTPRDQAFCGFALNGNQVMIVEDAQLDERFHDNPLVTGEPHIRFYAGVPLRVSDGSALGTLCIIDRNPRSLSENQIALLEAMADTAVDLIKLRLGSLLAEERLSRLQDQSDAIRRSSLFQSAVLGSAMDGIIAVDDHGVISTANPAAATLFGHNESELAGSSIGDHLDFGSEPIEFLKSELSRAMGRMALQRECRARRGDGVHFISEVAISSFTFSGARNFVLTVRDISERKKIDQMKSEFVATVSHELRTPLTAISGSLGLIAGGAAGELPGKAKSLIEIALNNGTRLVRLINDILDIEKLEAGQSVFNPAPVSLSSVVSQAAKEIESFAGKFEVSIKIAEIDRDAVVMADSDRLLQVITNLLSNAAKFSPQGSVIDVTADKRNRGWRLNIADRGKGIPHEFKAKVFDRFVQADGSNARKLGGTGLGLSIAREIMLRMDGNISFADRHGGGTVFCIDIPDIRSGRTEPRALIGHPQPDAASRACLQFERAGFDADLALSLDEFRALTAERCYSVLLLDLSIVGSDVAKLISELRERDDYSLTPIILTAFHATDTGSSAALAIANWFHKPLSSDAVRSGLRSLIGQASGQKPRILHIEDDADVLKLVALALNGQAQIHCVSTIKEAQAELCTYDFDLAILDLGLPEGSGTELLPNMWRSDGKPVPVVIFSARKDDPGISRKVNAVLTKSRASLSDLVAAVENVLGESEFPGGKARR